MRSKKLRALFWAGALSVALSGCGTTKIVQSWESDTIEPEHPEKVAVLVAWPDQLQRLSVERDMVAGLRKKGANAVESSKLAGMRDELTAKNAEKALRDANVDAVVIVFVIGGGGGASYQRADYWLDYVGSGMYGWYAPYFYDVYAVREGPGYSQKTTQVFLETTYVDVRHLQRVWSFVTQSKDIEYQDLAGRLTDKIASQMKHAGQL